MSCNSLTSTKNAATNRNRSQGRSTGVLDLLVRELISTQVTGASAAGWDSYVLTDESFEPLGPSIVDIIIHAEGLNLMTNFQYQVRLEYRMYDGSWGPAIGASPVILLGPVTTSGAKISQVFSDRTKLGLACRLVLDVQNSAAAVNVSATLSVSAAIRFYCGC
jgi:hypothetical protein